MHGSDLMTAAKFFPYSGRWVYLFRTQAQNLLLPLAVTVLSIHKRELSPSTQERGMLYKNEIEHEMCKNWVACLFFILISDIIDER